jgi:hypothetical protein
VFFSEDLFQCLTQCREKGFVQVVFVQAVVLAGLYVQKADCAEVFQGCLNFFVVLFDEFFGKLAIVPSQNWL